ncbi:MAG TPA: hypothetical protein H9835_07125, partial [Candidatus Agathobaculum merdigallinarum]|nr:hypothetical protein [Candidatus Agathobaculum merdigallinarum]
EDRRQNLYRTENEFRAAADRYIDFYNDCRPHQRFGFLTPNQAETDYDPLYKEMPTVPEQSKKSCPI